MIESRCSRLTRHLKAAFGNSDLLIIASGRPIQKPGGLDQTYPFLPEPTYQWLTGSRRPGGAVVYSNLTGWRHFVEPVTDEERMWEGQSEEAAKGEPASALGPLLEKIKPTNRVFIGNPDPALLTDAGGSQRHEPVLKKEVLRIFDSERRIKDEAEIDTIRQAANAASVGYAQVEAILRPGLTELDVQLEFESAVRRAGADGFPYDTLVGSGPRSAILHALPSRRTIGDDDMILIDGGAEIQDYCVDITRVFHPRRAFNSRQSVIIQIVKEAQLKAISMCQEGVEWHEVHRTAAVSMAGALVSCGLMRGDAHELADRGAIAALFPHGVGHMVGLRVRDVGGREPGRLDRLCCGVKVRVDLPLRNGFIMTVEPGLYFIPERLHFFRTSTEFSDCFNWSEMAKFMDVGGVRIEDDILLTPGGPINLTGSVPSP